MGAATKEHGWTLKIGELERLIKKYQASYYSGEGEISDAEFDALWDTLKLRAPESSLLKAVGAEKESVDGFPKTKHIIPMGSQEKAAGEGEFLTWAKKLNLEAFIVQFKLDGASLELQYEDGILARAVTRGNGEIGDDITANALKMRGVAGNIGSGWSGGVRGEVVMFHDVWKSKYSVKANCRNAANGLMRRKDGEGCQDLTVICYDASAWTDFGAGSGADSKIESFFKTEREKIDWLKSKGFITVETEELKSAEAVIAYRKKIAKKRADLPFDIDGLVVKDPLTDLEDLRKARPEKQIAFKFDLERAISVLLDIQWSESGATYTPIGIVEPVRLAGTTVRRANLNNPDMIRGMGLEIGSKVYVVKRGEIIPKIEGLAESGERGEKDGSAAANRDKSESLFKIEFPSHCSACGAELVDAGTRLYCPNQSCPKRLLHRLEKWVATLDIGEIGVKLIRQLFDSGRLRHIADLYSLNIEELASYERMGELSASKVLRNIKNARSISLSIFVAGFDIEGVGETIMDIVVDAGFDSLEKLRAASAEDLGAIHGIGGITAEAIVDGLKETQNDMDDTLRLSALSIAPVEKKSGLPLAALSFCFTGELKAMKRTEAQARVKKLGGTVKSSVTKDLTYLVTNNSESGSSKNKTARALGVKIINEDEFLGLLESGKN